MKTRKFSCVLVLLLLLGGLRSSEAQSNFYTNIWVDKLNSEQSECSIALHPLNKNIQFVVWNDWSLGDSHCTVVRSSYRHLGRGELCARDHPDF